MSKHTEGKWGYEYSPANDAYEIAPIKDGELDWENEICMTADNDEAKAKLIRAAPEMLEMLKEVAKGNFNQADVLEKSRALITEIESE